MPEHAANFMSVLVKLRGFMLFISFMPFMSAFGEQWASPLFLV